MAKSSGKLKKVLGLVDVYAISTAATLSGGIFLLPGLAAESVGPAIILSYLIATIPLIPALLSMVELATAMPRSGGFYYFLDRSMGPLMGTIGGLGTWIALILKTAFALIGISVYLGLFFDNFPVKSVAVGFAVLFGALNLMGAKKTGGIQVVLALVLLAILAWFSAIGFIALDFSRFSSMLSQNSIDGIISTAGLVFVSYVGLTKIISVSEEVKNPERNLPLGIFLGFVTVIGVYVAVMTVLIGVIPMDRLAGEIAPVAVAAELLGGNLGKILVSIAAVFSFLAVANAGILSASRYPLAMSRDHLMPEFFGSLNKSKAPKMSIYVTVALISAIVLFIDVTKIAKLASAFLLFVFALICLAVIVMRESRIDSYDPGFRSPLYPWIQWIGIFTSIGLIFQIGGLAISVTLGVILSGIAWYFHFAGERVTRTGAIYHIFSRWGKQRFDEGLDRELRQIMREKGLRTEDPFEEVVAHAQIIDASSTADFKEIVEQASRRLATQLPLSSDELVQKFLEGTQVGATPVTHGIALPHLKLDNIDNASLVMVRSRPGISTSAIDLPEDFDDEEDIHAFFFLVSPLNDPKQHLRILASLAESVESKDFLSRWNVAKNEQELKELILKDERFIAIPVNRTGLTSDWIGKEIKIITIPEGCLIAMIRRDGQVIIPRGNTALLEDDLVTILGEPKGIIEIREKYHPA